jgi:hypothetical protein
MAPTPLRPRSVRPGRHGLGGQTGQGAGPLRGSGEGICSWGRDPGAADHLFKGHELGIVLARRMLG